ncbi:hypothetical protein INT43_005905 [Umbelopsis isabellina]|uniref:Uncharacterized protein n=1 Tax=Mortierella isabellina TaxID=91625 RepID=A0A8H7PJ00_MORIS|nr:hypothetical protein INT43_005905 [Umbelopsis isabellina]
MLISRAFEYPTLRSCTELAVFTVPAKWCKTYHDELRSELRSECKYRQFLRRAGNCVLSWMTGQETKFSACLWIIIDEAR